MTRCAIKSKIGCISQRCALVGIAHHILQTSIMVKDRLAQLKDRSADLPSSVHSAGSFFFVAPPMRCLDIVGMIVSPCAAHSFRILVIWNDVIVVGKLLMADGAFPVLLHNLPV
jgi:hypothetical protein